LATLLEWPSVARETRARERRRERWFSIGVVSCLTALAIGVHGYHPYAEDGGVYLPEIKRLLDPTLYPHGTEFVAGHLRLSLFAPMVACLVRWSHLSLQMTLLLLYAASDWVTLFAAWLLAERCWEQREARVGAVALLAVWLTLPVAGTSLMVMDPYMTARSVSTPLVLLALAGVLDGMRESDWRRWRGFAMCGVPLLVGTTMHPLMTAYGLGCAMVLACLLSGMPRLELWGTLGLSAAAMAAAGVVQGFGPAEDAAYLQVAMTRYYWFLSEWRWYEWIGLIAPLGIVAAVGFGRRRSGDEALIAIARMALACGLVALAVAGVFARESLATHVVARLQPLRVFQLVYVVMILVVGAGVGRVLKRRPVRWVAMFAVLAGVMFGAERITFPGSAHLELPGSGLKNPWEQAFAWISENTPKDALFALDADYISKRDEDAQCFRAVAGRSALPDYSKDGGEAAILPALTEAWMRGQAAQIDLSPEKDSARIRALRPLGVTWVVLEKSAVTGFWCDYENSAVKVCRLP
jgi:hypothetical protein